MSMSMEHSNLLTEEQQQRAWHVIVALYEGLDKGKIQLRGAPSRLLIDLARLACDITMPPLPGGADGIDELQHIHASQAAFDAERFRE